MGDFVNCSLWGGSIPFQLFQSTGDGGLDSRLRGNDGLTAGDAGLPAVVLPKLECYLMG